MDAIMVMEFDESNTQGNAPRGKEPLFYAEVTLDDSDDLPEKEIVPVEIEDFMPHPRGTSQTEDFDLLAHLTIEEPKDADADEDEDDGEEDEEAEAKKIFRLTAPKIQERWIKLVPDQNQFAQIIQKTFVDGLQAIKCFEKWAKHKELVQYLNALEAWDEKPGEDWDVTDTQNLDPYTWIFEHPTKAEAEQKVRTIMQSAYEKANQFLTRFQPLLEIYWRNKQFDMNILVDENLKNPVDSLSHTLNLLKYYQQYFQGNLPGITDIGLVQLDSRSIKEKLLPTPKDLQDEIEKLVPRKTRERTLEVHQWLTQSVRDLMKQINDVSDFVKQLQDWNRINDHFQTQRDKIDLYGQFQGVLANIGSTPLKKEDQNAIKDAEKESTRLSQIIAQVESKQEVETERFKKDLEQLIPQLSSEVDELIKESILPQYLDKASDMNEMIKQLDEKMATFKRLEETAIKYNGWQEELRTDQTNFENIEELREALTNRHLMWHSLDEWKQLKDNYDKTLFADIDAEEISKRADHYQKIANRIIKVLPPNPIQDELKELVETFKGAMPIVKALRNPVLDQSHMESINALIENGKIDVEQEGFTLQSLIDLNVVQY